MTLSITHRLAQELSASEEQVAAAISLLDDGATVPFIARYRKEVTGGLDDTQMRNLEARLYYLREMEDRRKTILESIESQGKLTPEITQAITEADSKNRLEDLYLPYKPKRRTKAQIAREAGLEPLANQLLDNPSLEPESTARGFLNKDAAIENVKDALDGARQIIMERFAEDAALLQQLREFLREHSHLAARVIEGKGESGAKFRDYFEHTEQLKSVPSHRALAMFRGRNDGFLHLSLVMSADEKLTDSHPCESMIANHFGIEDHARAADLWLRETVRWTWRVKLLTHLQTDVLGQLREHAEAGAIDVFASNLKNLLLAAPAGAKATMGLDPGLRTGVKVAVVDSTGKLLDHATVYPTAPQNKTREATATLLNLIKQHNVQLIATGNGTGGRETDQFVGSMLLSNHLSHVSKVMVNESGASIYSASEFAALEFPDLDVTIRGAVSIARRLQDPLSELVKIDPKSIGVGQYQHDVSQVQLARQLNAVVEDCVNAVGVDVNTASIPLLARVSGLNQSLADNIVRFRDTKGRFNSRQSLKQVPRLGEKTFEQAAGFLRISGGSNPLDACAVHPESYSVVEMIAESKQREPASLMGDSAFIRGIDPAHYVTTAVGLPTVKDILTELEKPGRDPRPDFQVATFADGVEKITDLQPDMILEGSITNVTDFGAFVDIGVHQDGLVHISALSDKFVKDPREIVKAGDIVRVKVMSVDVERKRIGLSMRLSDKAAEQDAGQSKNRPARRNERPKKKNESKPPENTLASAFANAKQRR
ncbi:MAG: Tex family protein [Halioglobus sp.]